MNYNEIIDIPSAKERFMGNWRLFTKFLYQFPARSLYGELEQALDANDAARGFELAHTMKGIAGNLSLKLIAQPLSNVVEPLRAGSLPDAAARAEFKSAYDSTVEAIKQLEAGGAPLF